jgi:hypothetical protein
MPLSSPVQPVLGVGKVVADPLTKTVRIDPVNSFALRVGHVECAGVKVTQRRSF